MVYKKYQCRYFHSDGRSKVPTCNQGSHCRFLHPDDEGWPGLKPKSHEKRSDDIYTTNSLPRRSEPRSAPLVSQDDLFLRTLLSEDDPPFRSSSQTRRQSVGFSDDYRDRGRDIKKSKNITPRNNSKNRARRYDDVSYLGVKKPEISVHSPNANSQKSRVVSGTKRKHSEDLESSMIKAKAPSHPAENNKMKTHLCDTSVTSSCAVFSSPIARSSTPGLKLNGPDNVPRRNMGQEVVSLFRELSRLAAQAAEDAVIQAKDDKKLKAYTDLSSLLSKISPKAAVAVASPLADIFLRHAQGKERAEANLKAISEVWTQAFDMLTGEMSRAVDLILADAMRNIAEAANLANKTASHEQSGNSGNETCRVRGDHIDNTSYETRHLKEGDLDSRRDQKRRRLSPPLDTKPIAVRTEQNVHEILKQMKTKIDEQAQTLHKLTKENNELKASLRQQPVAASSSANEFL